MRRSNRIKIAFSAVALLSLVAMTVAGLHLTSSAGTAHAAGTPHVTHAKMSYKGKIDLRQVAKSTPKEKAGTSTGKFTIPDPKIPRHGSRSAPIHATAKPNPFSTTHPLRRNIVGGDAVLNNALNPAFGQDEPPDQGLCSGPDAIFGGNTITEVINEEFVEFAPNGSIDFAAPLNELFAEPIPFVGPPSNVQGDVRCYYDATTGSYFFTQLYYDFTHNLSHVDVAVAPFGTPLILFEYAFDTTDQNVSACNPGCLPDQPLFGIDNSNIYIATNDFNLIQGTFVGGQIYAIDKAALVGGGIPNFVHYSNLINADGSVAASTEPAITNVATPSGEFFSESLDPTGAGDNRIAIWALTNPSLVGSGGTPTLSTVIISSENYALPPSADSTGGVQLQCDDDRMLQAQETIDRFGREDVWSTLDTAITPSGDSTVRCGAAWFVVRPHVSGGVITGASMANQGYLALTGLNILYPATYISTDGTQGMVFSVTGPSLNPVTAYTSRNTATTSTFGMIFSYGGGAGPDQGFTCSPCRWGDYSAAGYDNLGDKGGTNNLLIATEDIDQPTAGSVFANWGTQIGEIAG